MKSTLNFTLLLKGAWMNRVVFQCWIAAAAGWLRRVLELTCLLSK